MRKRFKKTGLQLFVFLFLGIGYYIFYQKTGLGIPCLFHSVTGLYCPGCGITRVITYTVQGEFLTAMGYNHALFFLLPVLAVLFLSMMISYIKTGNKKLSSLQTFILCLIIIVLCSYALIKNILLIFGKL